MSEHEYAWNGRPGYLRMLANDWFSDFVTVHATNLVILTRVDVELIRRDTLCDDDELPAFCRKQAE